VNKPQFAVIGGGVIGAGWAARMALSGHTVRVYDPSAATNAIVDGTIERARQAWVDLELPLASSPNLSIVGSVAEAVTDADFVQESVPENPDLKASVHAEIESAVASDTIIASSTSGIRPSTMQASLSHPERLVVGHPFNPVYLLPLVEVVGGEHTPPIVIERAMAVYRDIGMHPLHVRVEIDAFIADRLLEAVWREALWLIKDGVATTAEIDDAIIYGFGLRWAQMGLFDTYRVAGGPGGFRHFLAQFGPTLSWPWTKLMDVPEFTDELVDTIVLQSDEQSGHLELNEMEQTRDENLVAILRVLEKNRWGAGNALAAHRANLEAGELSSGPAPISE